MNEIARSIYIARIEKGLSQKELALKANIPQPNISKIEQGRDFRVSTLYQLAFALDVSVDNLISGIRTKKLNKRNLFKRRNIEKTIACVVNNENAPRELKPAVELISSIIGRNKEVHTSKKSSHLSWYRLKRSFSGEEINTILSRIYKAKQRSQ